MLIPAIRRWSLRTAIAGIATGWALLGAGCASHRRSDSPPPAAALAVPPIRMQGSGTFFAGRLSATITISRGTSRGGSGSGSNGAAGARRSHRGTSAGDSDDTLGGGGSLRTDSPMPPVTLHLKFQNHSKQTLIFGVEDFESDLGNFAVHPEILSLTPDQTGEPDAMTSQLGVTADEVPMKVTLKLAGKTETQTIVVKVLEDPALSEWPGIRE